MKLSRSSPVYLIASGTGSTPHGDVRDTRYSSLSNAELPESSTDHGDHIPAPSTDAATSIEWSRPTPHSINLKDTQPAIATISPRRRHVKTVMAIIGFQLAGIFTLLDVKAYTDTTKPSYLL
jgi:hypothetical protein